MQKIAVSECDHLFDAANFKCSQVNKSSDVYNDDSYVKCLRKSRRLLKSLQLSLVKTWEYEDELTRCKHCPHVRDRVSSESIVNGYQTTAKALSPRHDIVGSSSNVTIAGLQNQYETISIRFGVLARAFDSHCQGYDRSCQGYDRSCQGLNRRCQDDVTDALQLRVHIHAWRSELTRLHATVMAIAERYLTLKYRSVQQKTRYKHRIARLKRTLPGLLWAVEGRHREFSHRLAQLPPMRDAAGTLLVAEMSKSNDLLLENIRLKTKLEMLIMD